MRLHHHHHHSLAKVCVLVLDEDDEVGWAAGHGPPLLYDTLLYLYAQLCSSSSAASASAWFPFDGCHVTIR